MPSYFLGASLYALGQLDEAVKPLETAEGRGVADAARILAIMALDRYDASDASKHIDAWAAALTKSKKPKSEEFEFISRRAIQLGNMLDRVECIEVIDSINVDSATFFEVYRLSSAAGSLLPPDAVSRLGAGGDANELSVAYMPENRSELLWPRPIHRVVSISMARIFSTTGQSTIRQYSTTPCAKVALHSFPS